MAGNTLKRTKCIHVNSDQVLYNSHKELPQRKLPCDQYAEKTILAHKEVSHPFFKGKLTLAKVESQGDCLLVNAPFISESSEMVNDLCSQSQGVFTSCNDPLLSNTFISNPLRLKGGGDTSFDCQDDVNVSFPSISTPLRIIGREEASVECREIISNMEGQGNGLFCSEISSPVGEIRMNDMSLENMISDVSSDTPYPQDVSTPTESFIEPTLSTLAELNPMAGQFIPPSTNLNPLADQFIPLLPDFSFSDTTLSGCVGNVSSSDGNDPLAVLNGLKEKNLERPIIADLNINSISSKFE